MICFTASYAVALGLELVGLWHRPAWRRWAVVIALIAGAIAHAWYLAGRIADEPAAPLSSRHDWYLAVSWLLSVIYVTLSVYYPKRSFGLFLLPVMLGLIGASHWAATAPLASADTERAWGQLHGVLLMLGAVAVLLGFVAGTMYLVQSYRLKHKFPTTSRLRLPSLEWLEAVNSRSLGAAMLLVALGFFTGVVARVANRRSADLPWNDPVVLSLGAMLLWLAAAELFRLVYPAARRGRKIAYLTIAAFVFLLITLASFTFNDTFHQGERVLDQQPLGAPLSLSRPAPRVDAASLVLARDFRTIGGRRWIYE
jgi:ABC-type uncharacterized transport system permease subunit